MCALVINYSFYVCPMYELLLCMYVVLLVARVITMWLLSGMFVHNSHAEVHCTYVCIIFSYMICNCAQFTYWIGSLTDVYKVWSSIWS